MSPPYPFPFLNHGYPSHEAVGKWGSCYLGFETEVAPVDRAWIEAACPPPLTESAWGATLYYGSNPGGAFSAEIMFAYHEGPRPDRYWAEEPEIRLFADAFEGWTLRVHKRAPLRFVIGPFPGGHDGPWNAWSRATLAPVLLSFVERWLDEHAAVVGPGSVLDGAFGTRSLPYLLHYLPYSLRKDSARLARIRARLAALNVAPQPR